MAENILFTKLKLGALDLPHRIIMAPLTRMRCGTEGIPSALNAEYYAQRATAALIISEGTAVSHQGQGYPGAPGIYTAAQIAGWRAVTDAVHAEGGSIIMQLAHNGRNSHSSLQPNGALPVAPSSIPPALSAYTIDFQAVPAQIPRSLEISEIPGVVTSFRQAAANAMTAGFDGVEIQSANGHLIEQFLENGTNRRTDRYGGSPENRARLLLEIIEEVAAAIGGDRLGVRLSPFGQYGGIRDSDPLGLFTFVIGELSKRRIAYLHMIEARGSELGLTDDLHDDALSNSALFRRLFDGPLISAAAYSPFSAVRAVEMKQADAIAFGRLFISNPDLVRRIKENRSLNDFDRKTFYGGGEHGYTDYEFVKEQDCDRLSAKFSGRTDASLT